MDRPAYPTILPLAAASFLSGFAALAYQATWQRVLTQSIGADAVSMALIVAIFMAGLGLGALIAPLLLHRDARTLARRYAILELGIGAFGVFSVTAIRSVNALLGEWSANSLWLDAAVNFAVLLGPIVLMGMTSPIVVEIGKQRLDNFGRRAGLLYGLNILGAAVGAALTGLVAIELLGLSATCTAAALLNLIAAILVLRLRAAGDAAPDAEETRVRGRADPPGLRFLLGCVLLGYASIALQMLYFRVLANYFTLSSIVFPVVLTAFLVLMSVGQSLGGSLSDRYETRSYPSLLAGLYGVSVVLLVAAMLFPPAWATVLGAQVFSPSVESLLSGGAARFGDPNPLVAFGFALVLMLAVLPQSALFPVAVKLATKRIEEAGRRFAQIYAAYTIGNVSGSLITGLVLFEFAGTFGALAATIIAGALGVAALCPPQRWQRPLLATGAAAAIALALLPRDYYRGFTGGRYVPAEILEGRTGVVTVVPTDRFYTLVDMFRTESASAITRPPRAGESYEAWRWNFSDLLALDPQFRPKQILLIGIGHGYLPLTLLEYDFIERIVVVDISAEIIAAVEKHSSTDLKRVFNDPRVEIVIADGRRYLQGAIARGERFDLIQNRINEPWRAGGGSLFTVEFFGLMKRALNPNGYVATRHMTGYAVNALEMFTHGVWTKGSYHMYFSDRAVTTGTEPRISADIRRAFLSAYPGEAQEPAKRTPLAIVALAREQFREHALNTDDRPRFEYYLLDDARDRRMRKQRVYLESLDLPAVTKPVTFASP